jgi:hypothetical protein
VEYLLVTFDRVRRVTVDDSPFGWTNTVIQIEAGTHTITLAAPPDFSPLTQTVVIANTSALDPLKVTFHRLPPSAMLTAAGLRP